ncbi:TonB-dependent receptor plug domain-containing protein, partial [bacterium]|nr:TonB-dependent receptor plug domain-containing protein [bacterium]
MRSLRIALFLVYTLLTAGNPQAVAEPSETGSGAVSGRVIEQATRNPIAAANVIVEGTARGAATDLEGRYRIDNLPPGTYRIRATAIGYVPHAQDEIAIRPGRTTVVEFQLKATLVEGEEVIFTAGYFESDTPDLPTSSRSLRYEEIRRAPGAAEDIQRALQALPGVAGQSDQNNEIVVRGGNPSENLIVMDGIEVENLNHFGFVGSTGGPISALNNEFLRDVTFASGGFSARYGDKLSSVLDLDLRAGSREQTTGAIDLGMAGVGGNFEGPIGGGRGSY